MWVLLGLLILVILYHSTRARNPKKQGHRQGPPPPPPPPPPLPPDPAIITVHALDGVVMGVYLYYYSVLRPILDTLTLQRLRRSAVPAPPEIVLREDDPEFQQLLPVGPALEHDGWTVANPGLPHIYFLYHSELFVVPHTGDLQLAHLANLEAVVALESLQHLHLVEDRLATGDWINHLQDSYYGGYLKIVHGEQNTVDVIVYWCSYSHHTGLWP